MKKAFSMGMLFTAIGQYSNIVIQLLINIIFARIIPVEEFGIMANVQVFLLFFQLVVTMGMGPAIIQNKQLKSKDYGVLFNFSILFAIAFFFLFGLLGYGVAAIYHNSVYVHLFWMVSIIVLCDGINVVPTALLSKELRFRTLNIRMLICNLSGVLLGIIAAYLGLGIYALIISIAAPSILTVPVNFLLVKINYTRKISLPVFKNIFGFSRNQLSFELLNYISRNFDKLLIGKFLGPVPLANYQKAYQLIMIPNTAFLGVISPILQPFLSDHQDNIALIKDIFLKIVRVLGLIGFATTVFFIINAQDIILFLFGPNWYAVVPPFQILAFSIWAQMLTTITNSIYMARNHSHTLLKMGIISAGVILPLTIVGVLSSHLTFVALCVCIAYLLNFLISYWILMKEVLKGKLSEALKELTMPVVIGVILLVILSILNPMIRLESLFLQLLVKGIVWLFFLFICLVVTGELKRIRSLFNNRKTKL